MKWSKHEIQNKSLWLFKRKNDYKLTGILDPNLFIQSKYLIKPKERTANRLVVYLYHNACSACEDLGWVCSQTNAFLKIGN